MRIAGLFAVFALARATILAGHHVPFSWWSLPAYLWQDALVVLVFGCVEFFFRARPIVVRAVYAILVGYIVINIPVARVLSTPLTWSMWHAARGALADSIWLYVTWQYALLMISVLLFASLAPHVFRRVPRRPLLATMGLCVALGPAAVARVDTRGLERNAWTALIGTAVPRAVVRSTADHWQTAGFDRTRYEDLTRFAGSAAGYNIVLVSLESTAAQYLGVYGAQPDVMPNLSELARTAVVFENAYAAYPESIKGLFSILCSTYPAFDSTAELYARVPCRSIAAVLAEHGYRTALFHSGRFMYLGMDGIIRNRGYGTLRDAGDIGGKHNSSFGVDEPSTVGRILSWIDTVPRDDRFFVTYLPIAGHHPYETLEPGPFADHDEFGRYRNALHDGDTSLGTLMRGLRARGLERRTLWIVFGDHGEAFGQHDGNYGHTFFLYDENVRVPFLIAAPGFLSNQIRSRRVVSLIDTAPTLLELVGLRAPEGYQGQSMLAAEPRMAFFFADYSLGMLGLRDGPLKFIYELDAGRVKLFDVDRDPRETTDLSGRDVERAEWYAQNLRNWSAAQSQKLQ